MAVYFGGSRYQYHQLVPAVVAAVVGSGHSVHVGCQFGADRQVVQSCPPSFLVVFAVAPSAPFAPAGCRVVISAGGSSAPMPARYLLRSIAAFRGCSAAVFFQPGSGSLAVARECVRQGLPVFAFATAPTRIPSVSGQWVASSFAGFSCWQWQAPSQPSLF